MDSSSSLHLVASPAPKRSRRKTLTGIDRRSVLGKRVAELTAAYADAMEGELTPLRRAAVERAAQLTAVAEKARGDFMRGGDVALNQLTRAERNATQARRELGLPATDAKPRGPTLAEVLAEAAARRDAEEDAEPEADAVEEAAP
jgi:hypothetical protein